VCHRALAGECDNSCSRDLVETPFFMTCLNLRGRRCLVVLAPFRHHGGGTRTRDFTRDPARQRADLAMRDAALVRFTQKWHHRLPCDVRSARQRVGDWFRTKLA